MEDEIFDCYNKIEKKHWWFQGRKEIITKLIDKYYKARPNAKVLDIGCGTGIMLEHLKKFGEVWGVDCSRKALEYSKIKSPEAKIVRGSLPCDMPEEKFDLVLALDVLEHIDEDEKALESILSILKPGGIFIATVPAYNFLWSAHDIANHHKRRYDLLELKTKLEKSGFGIEKISYFSALLFLPAVFSIFFKKIFLRKKSDLHFKKVPNFFLNFLLKLVFSLEKHLIFFVNFPFGISLVSVSSKKSLTAKSATIAKQQ